jgi:MFS family permease
LNRLVQRYRSFSAPARAFLAGAALLEIGHAFQYALQNLYVMSLGVYTVADAGLVNGASALAVVLATIPSAWLYEHLGPRRSLVAALVLNVVAIAGMAFATSLAALLLWSALSGAAYALHKVVAAPFLVSTSKAGERTHLFQADFAVHTVTMTLGLLVSCVIAGALEGRLVGETVAVRAALLAGAGLSLFALLPYRGLPERAEDGGDALRSPLQTLSILRPRHWHLWFRVSVPHFLVGTGAGLSIPFINLYFTDRFALTKTTLGLVLAGASATMTLGALATPRVVARLGLVRATIATEAFSIPFFLLLALTTSFPVAVAAYVLRSALMNLSQPLWRNLMMEITPVTWRPAVNGVSMLCWNLGWAVSNQWGGELIDHSAGWLGAGFDGYALPMLLTIGTYLLAITLEALFFWHVRHIGQARAPGAALAQSAAEAPSEQAA